MSEEAAFALADAIERLAGAITSLWAVPLLLVAFLIVVAAHEDGR